MSATSPKVTCDGCGDDITATGNSVDYRIILADERIPGWGGAVTDMMIYPPLGKTMHFCGVGCLKSKVESL